MDRLARHWRRLRAWLRSRRLSKDVDEEMAFHLAMEAEKHAASGLGPDEAARRAARAFGNPITVREDVREAHGLAWWDALVADLRIAVRGIRRAPGFHTLLVGTLGLAIGLAATVMAAVDAVLLRPVPYVDTEHTVEVWPVDDQGAARPTMTMDSWNALAGQGAPFTAVAAYDRRGVEYSGPDDATILAAAFVSEDFFRVLPVPAWRGRLLGRGDYAGGVPVVVVSHRFWLDHLGATTTPIGTTLRLDGKVTTVVGVLPADFGYPQHDVDLWVPMPHERSDRFVVWALALTRGDPESAGRLADRYARTLGAERPELGLEHGVRLQRFGARRANPKTVLAFRLTVAAVLAVLLVSTANATNLLCVRALGRRREFSMRLALGAGRWRLVRQLLVEALVVSVVVAVVALLAADLGVRALRQLLPPDFTWQAFHSVEMSSRVVNGALTTVVGLSLLSGLWPAIRASRSDAMVFRSGGLANAGATARGGAGAGLVALELAFSGLLLLGGGLFARSFRALNRVDLGVDAGHLAVVDLQRSRVRYPDSTSWARYLHVVDETLRRLPGVQDVTITDGMAPRTGMYFGAAIRVDGAAAPQGNPGIIARSSVAPGYFAIVGTPVVQGRGFELGDERPSGVHPVLVSRDFATWLFGGADPIGRRFQLDESEGWFTVIGVAGNARLAGPDDRESPFAFYEPFGGRCGYCSIAVRTDGDPAALLAPIHRAVRAIDPEQPIVSVETAGGRFREKTEGPRFLTWLMAMFAVVGLSVSLVGLYGVLAHAVSQRAREIGIRMAVGATSRRIVLSVLRQASGVVVTGVGAAVVVAAVLAPRLRPLLYGVAPRDLVVFVGVPILLVVVAGLAGWVPSRRASQVEPMSVLRID